MSIPSVPRKLVIGHRDELDEKRRGYRRIFNLECGHEYVIARSLCRKNPEALACGACWRKIMDEKFPNRAGRERVPK